ncbi:MAG: cation:proton antiporter [Bacteroidetes bacterium]|nr:MAG: cation:proton antiporter [Bacteroidota bacterium]
MANIIFSIAILIIGLSFLLVIVRFLKGKTIADRVVALDVLTISSIGLIVLLAHFLDRGIYIDVSIIYAILSFIGVIIVAKYLEKSL